MNIKFNNLIVVVDNNEESILPIIEGLEDEGFEVLVAVNHDDFIFKVGDQMPEAIILRFDTVDDAIKDDLFKLRGENRYLNVPILALTKTIDEDAYTSLIDSGVDHVCHQPYITGNILQHVEQLISLQNAKKEMNKEELALSALRDENNRLNKELEKLEGTIRELQEGYERISIIDTLTGLYNRKYLFEHLMNSISRFSRSNVKSSIILCDVDGFKNINLNYGQKRGDHLLREIGIEMMENKRIQDIISRYEADQFMLLLPDTDEEGAWIFAERTRQLIEEKFFEENLKVTMSFGVSTYDRTMPMDMLLKMTEDALDMAKSQGKNKIIHSAHVVDFKKN